MSDFAGKLVVTVRPSLVASWFHHLLTRPFVDIDGIEHPVAWGTTALHVGPGARRISVFFRYRGQHAARLGEGGAELPAVGPQGLRVRAQLGVRNGSPFHVTGPGVSGQWPPRSFAELAERRA
jgi:hypothetical protein